MCFGFAIRPLMQTQSKAREPTPAAAVHSQVAVFFDHALDVRAAGYALPSPLLASETERGMPYPDRPSSHDIEFADAPSAEENPSLPIVASRLV